MKKQFYIVWGDFTLCNFEIDNWGYTRSSGIPTFQNCKDFSEFKTFDSENSAENFLRTYIIENQISTGSIFEIKSFYVVEL
jgi:hypothetical protein